MAQVSGVSSVRPQPVLGVLVRSLGWVAFAVLMGVSFASMADVPRGGVPDDHAHVAALVLAAACWAACFAVSRWARATGRAGRSFRPVVLRVAALVAVAGISVFVAWHADASTRHDVGRMESYYREFQRIAPGEYTALATTFQRVSLPRDLRPRQVCSSGARCPDGVLGTWSSRGDAESLARDLLQRFRAVGQPELKPDDFGHGWTVSVATAAGELRVDVRATAARTFVSALSLPRRPPCEPGDPAFNGCSLRPAK